MQLVEIRDLDGPNLFSLQPVIKLEVCHTRDEEVPSKLRSNAGTLLGADIARNPATALTTAIERLHLYLDLRPPEITVHQMDTAGHFSVCFPWEHRAQARAIARVAFEVLTFSEIDHIETWLTRTILEETDPEEPDEPTWVRDAERRIPCAAITGTNGKTTTTRFLAHILRESGKRVGWSSSSGVYIEGEQVIDGDYTGHGGARRVLIDDGVDCAVLETARGGILLRGLGYESNDVGVFINVSEDHLDLHGVRTVETLAKVKATVIRTTHPGGNVILNADDPLVLAQKPDVRAPVILISQDPENVSLQEHLAGGGRALIVDDGNVTLCTGDLREHVISIADVPLTYGGMARHMIENTLAAGAAAIGMGVELPTIAESMRSFHPDRVHNAGRLNVFELNGKAVIIDFAHNESGLRFLLDFARQLFPERSSLTAIVGTAGDRQDTVFTGIGRIAGELTDRVVIKYNPRFLRGRTAETSVDLVLSGLREADAEHRHAGTYASEYDAVMSTIDAANCGDVIVAMCVEDYLAIMDELVQRGASEHTLAGA